jgi:uncharacterized protein involved in outer membrane biogenesis
MKRRRKVLAWIVGSVLVLLVAAVVAIALFDWNWLKPTINAKVSQAIGRPFTIQGDLSVAWRREHDGGWHALLPWPEFTARDIRIGNPAWASQAQFAQLTYVRFRLSPLPLLAHRVVIPMLQLGLPTVNLQRDRLGRANWSFLLPTSDAPSAWRLELDAIGFDRGRATLDDALNALKLDVAITPLQQAIPYNQIVAQQASDARAEAGKTAGAAARKALADAASAPASATSAGAPSKNPPAVISSYMFAWTAQGSYQKNPVKGSGKTGAVLALQRNDQPFPVQADMRIGDSHIALVGSLTDPLNLGALDVRLWFSGSSMAKLYPIIGVTLPDTSPYATEGHLRANLGQRGSRFSYENFKGRVGGSDLAGNLLFVTGGARPRLSGELRSKLLQFSDLAPLIGAPSDAQQAPPDAAAQPADKLLPRAAFRTERWNAMDADVRFSGARIVHGEKLPFESLNTHVFMNDGALKLDPLNFGMAGGTVESRLDLDGRDSPMRGDLRLRARHLKLKQLFLQFAPMQTSFGEINGDAALNARGNSVATLLGSANGELKLLMNDGAISKTLLETAGLNVANVVIGRLFGDKTVKINCAAADMVARNGLVDSRLFVLDTTEAVIQISGTINFATEQLDLDVRPHTKGFRVFSLRSPLYVKGTLKDPDVGVQPGTLILRGGGAVALAVLAAPVAALLPLVVPSQGDDGANACGPILEQMRAPSQTRPGPAKPIPTKR